MHAHTHIHVCVLMRQGINISCKINKMNTIFFYSRLKRGGQDGLFSPSHNDLAGGIGDCHNTGRSGKEQEPNMPACTPLEDQWDSANGWDGGPSDSGDPVEGQLTVLP